VVAVPDNRSLALGDIDFVRFDQYPLTVVSSIAYRNHSGAQLQRPELRSGRSTTEEDYVSHGN